MRRFCMMAATSAFLSIPQIASADNCSGQDHDTATALGAEAGGVAGGVAGNTVARSDDCAKERRADAEAERHAGVYARGYEDRAAEERAVAQDRVAVKAPRPLHDDVPDVPERADRDNYQQ